MLGNFTRLGFYTLPLELLTKYLLYQNLPCLLTMDEKTEFRAFLLEIVYNLTNHDVKAIKFLINGRVRRCRLDKADSVDLLEILGELGFWSWTKRGPVGLVQFAELCRSVQRMDLSIRIMEYDSAHHSYEGTSA